MNILGEQAKWVPISPQRVKNIQQDTTSMRIQLSGALNESVTFGFSVNYKYMSVDCDFGSKTQMTIQVLVSSTVQLNCS